jgi:uncharacterized cupin superfamily protein
VPNVFEPEFDERSVRYDFDYRRARLGYQAGCERLGVSVWELPPGQEGAYHWHAGNEELLWALTDGAAVRTPAGWRELAEGEVAAFPRGAAGAHAIANRVDAPVRCLFFSEMRGPEVVLYPDLGAVGAVEAMTSPERGGFAAWLRLADAFERHGPDPSDGPSPGDLAGRASVREPLFDAEQDHPGFRWRRARLARQAGAERLGVSLFELPPGQATFPYHFHYGNEELLVVVRGRPGLRTPEGWRELAEGELVAFPVGERGAHQVVNRGRGTARVLLVSQMVAPDVVQMPDSGKVQAREAAPGSPDRGYWGIFRTSDSLGYFEGEEAPTLG